jgi:hypothetical protein
MLIFFDVILIYNSSWSKHLQHVRLVLEALRAHDIHLKRSKCSSGEPSIAYLGHVISANSVTMDTVKVDVVLSWPEPCSPQVCVAPETSRLLLQVHLGLRTIVVPMTQLLCKDAFA